MIEPPVSPANLEKIHGLIQEAAAADLPAAGCWLPELRCVLICHVVAGACVGWILAPAATSEDGKKVAALWSTFWQDVSRAIDQNAEQTARDWIDAAKKFH